MTPKPRGGTRPGAGRKPSTGATERITITLAPADIEALRSISPNLSAAVRKLIADRAPTK